jgi:hypothetical protein
MEELKDSKVLYLVIFTPFRRGKKFNENISHSPLPTPV